MHINKLKQIGLARTGGEWTTEILTLKERGFAVARGPYRELTDDIGGSIRANDDANFIKCAASHWEAIIRVLEAAKYLRHVTGDGDNGPTRHFADEWYELDIALQKLESLP